jgi:hypothetical protein
MLTKKKVLSLALTLAKAGDSDLLCGEELLVTEGLDEEDEARIRDIGEAVAVLCKDYSYLQSTAFAKEIRGKSESFVSMKAKMEAAPTKKKERLESLYAVIRNLEEDVQPLSELVPEDQRPTAQRLAASLAALTLPKM